MGDFDSDFKGEHVFSEQLDRCLVLGNQMYQTLLVKFACVLKYEVVNDKYSYEPIQSNSTKGLSWRGWILTLPNAMFATEGKDTAQMWDLVMLSWSLLQLKVLRDMMRWIWKPLQQERSVRSYSKTDQQGCITEKLSMAFDNENNSLCWEKK